MLITVTGVRVPVLWMLGAFVVTFVVTRLIVRSIRRGSSTFKDTTVGGVHVHHQVYGIFLLLGVGAAEFTYRPPSPWLEVLAALFGVGAALTLDEFALWLRLDDVYWAAEGRRSVDAVLVAAALGLMLMVGANPFDADDAGPGWGVMVTIGINVLASVIAIGKGRIVLGLVGVLLPVVSWVAALRLARPRSFWAQKFYRAGGERATRAERRFPPGSRSRWDRVVDLFADAPAPRAARPRTDGPGTGGPHADDQSPAGR
ncbi:hypothetical protein [Pseudonocardia endophytica]|uniref:Integral membrane protein n=1 Tax=Pseudonocardia endophytica TaxID=401976 RepID=A0A4R1HHK0_PSEEN|nr:hypothetical protein [Pseudonocardia endophytica]TCK21714.1 hypothetical protein EV378_5705 [Pseudonocardia endophytica]